MTKKRRAEVFLAADGTCHICSEKISDAEKWEVEHVIPIQLGGEDDIPNTQPAHVSCHKAKTKTDITQIAKAKRVEKKHNGTFRPPRNIVPGSRASRFKKKLNGKVEIREKT